MLLTLLFFLLIILGRMLIKVYYKYTNGWVLNIASAIIPIGLIGLIICLLLTLNNAFRTNTNYRFRVTERTSLEYRLSTKDKSNDQSLYYDIDHYNKSIKRAKKYANNIWVNWFVNKRIADLDLIDIGE